MSRATAVTASGPPEDRSTEIVAVQTAPAPPARTDMSEWSVEDLLTHVHKVREVMKRAMKAGVHYGRIPGTDKDTLYQPGSQLLALMFRLHPEFSIVETHDGDHLEVVSTCVLYHIPTGRKMGSGVGSCSSKETRYAYRNANRKCPSCGKEAIIKGKAEYGGGWVCFKKKDGCGAKFPDNAPEIVKQETGRIPNPDLPDTWNGVRKVGNKRSMATAILNATGASDVFTCDLEDFVPPDDPGPTFDRSQAQAPPTQTYIDAEGTTTPADDIPSAQSQPKKAAQPSGMPSELKAVLDQIDASKSVKELFSLMGAVQGLDKFIQQDATRAFNERLTALKGP